MDEYIYVRWELRENRYMALDWSYEPIRGYEKEKITESLIKTIKAFFEEDCDFEVMIFNHIKPELAQALVRGFRDADGKNI